MVDSGTTKARARIKVGHPVKEVGKPLQSLLLFKEQLLLDQDLIAMKCPQTYTLASPQTSMVCFSVRLLVCNATRPHVATCY